MFIILGMFDDFKAKPVFILLLNGSKTFFHFLFIYLYSYMNHFINLYQFEFYRYANYENDK